MNSKAVAVYIVLLVIISGIAYFVLPHSGSKSPITAQTTIPGATTSITGNGTVKNNTSTTTVVPSNYSSCISLSPTVAIFNGNFSTGTYAGWSTSGTGFGNTPTNKTEANAQGAYYSGPWSGWNGTFFASNYRGGLQVVGGNLTTAPFLVTEPYLNLKVISRQSSLLYVQILTNNTPAITAYFDSYKVPGNGANASSTFVNASLNLLPIICDKAQIKVVAGTGIVTGGNANLNYIAVADFYLSKKSISSPDVIVNQTVNLSR